MPNMTHYLSLTCLVIASSLSWAADSAVPAQMPMHEQGQMQGKMHERMQERMKAMDTNGDGNISKAEFMANAEKHFQKMDSNGDGQVSAQERSQMQQRKGQGDTQHHGESAP